MKLQMNTEKDRFFFEFQNSDLGFLILRKSVFICLHLWMVFLFASLIAAQTVSGIVTDQKDAPVQNAEISLSNQSQSIARTTTDAEGKFSVDLQNAPNARLLVKAQGFASFSKILHAGF